MKHLIYFFFLCICAVRPITGYGADELPKPLGAVSDYAGVLDAQARQQITDVINEVEQKTSAEIAVVTVPDLGGAPVEDFATRLFAAWGLGKKGKDNGVLLLAAVNDRKVRIEVGYGLEGIIPDGRAGRILDEFVLPYFKDADYAKGLMLGTLAIGTAIADDAKVTLDGKYRLPSTGRRQTLVETLFPLFFFVLLFIILPILARRSNRGRRGDPGGYWGGMGGGFGGGFGGGGFGGFGGGGSGGGGASRGW